MASLRPHHRQLTDSTRLASTGLLDAVVAGQVEVPELGGTTGADHVEAGQVAAPGTTPAMRLVGKGDAHVPTLDSQAEIAGVTCTAETTGAPATRARRRGIVRGSL